MVPLNDVERTNIKLKELMSVAFRVDLKETFSFLGQFSTVQQGIIDSTIPTLNGLAVDFKKGDRAFEFSTGPINSVGPPAIYQSSYYGLSKPFNIIWNEKTLMVANGVGEGDVHLGKGFSTSGKLYDLASDFSDEKKYFRAVLPLRKMMHRPINYMKGEDFVQGTAYRPCGMIRLHLNCVQLRFFDYD
jgi:hypothetical protein